MNTRAGNDGSGARAVTRRDVLKTGLAVGLGLGAASLMAAIPTSTPTAAAAGMYGGHATVLSYAYPEVWDPHLGGNLAVTAAVSPLYNQVVEFNPLIPREVIGDF